ncbi:hypothetical protein [Peribacillus frigoritolerans]|uniref:hypothetical protein n=1 Tax=Peribacillus castrilensis TaxID=2897690 RepID=UPI00296F285A|nr:hypothetical protein [Peribacillus castrilensis]
MSGGLSTSRGIVYQGIVCVLDSLKKVEWSTVSVEPEVEEKDSDKVDILWTLVDSKGKKTKKATQVKTTIRQFSIGDIGKWLTDIISKKPDCNEYELLLIGNLAPSAYNLAYKINNQEAFTENGEKKWKGLEKYFGKISVVIHPICDELFIRAIVTYLTELGEFYGLNLKYDDYYFACKALIGDIQVLSTKSVDIERCEYEKQIVEWLSKIRQEETKWKEASDKAYKYIIEETNKLCDLQNWTKWYNGLCIQPISINPDQITNFQIFIQKLKGFNWPGDSNKIIELENALKNFSDNLDKVVDTFSNKCGYNYKTGMNEVLKGFYIPGRSTAEEDQQAKEYYVWLNKFKNLILELSKSANLFAKIVREKIDPGFLLLNGKLGGHSYSEEEIQIIIVS